MAEPDQTARQRSTADHVLSYTDNGYYEVDLKGHFQFCNDAFLKLFGQPRTQIYGGTFKQLADQKTGAALARAFKRVLQTRETISGFEYLFFDSRGKKLSGEMSICPLLDRADQVSGFYGLLKDRTQIKAFSADLEINQAGLERMISSRALEMKEEIEQKEHIKTINTALFSISTAINTTKNLDELYPVIYTHLSTILRLDHFYLGILNQEKDIIDIQYRVDPGARPMKDMKTFPLQGTLVGKVIRENKPLLLNKSQMVKFNWNEKKYGPVPDRWMGVPLISQEKVIGAIFAYSESFEDRFSKDDFNALTSVSGQVGFAIERRQILDQLSAREEKYSRLVETTTAGYWQVDRDDLTTGVNPALCKMLGYTQEQILGRNFSQFIDPKSKSTYLEVLKKSRIVKNRQYELVFRKKDGSRMYAKMDATSVFDDQKKFAGSFAVITDITDSVLFQKELSRAKERAEDASRAKSQFLANMSHEIRTPLNGVMGMAELLSESRLDDNQESLAQIISDEADALLTIINAILDFSKIEAGKMELEEIPFDLRHLFEDFSGSVAIQAEKKGLDFFSFLDPGIPSGLKGDPGRLRQVFTNLVGNALKFTSQGEIFISGKLEKKFPGQVAVRFEVSDTGVGIPEEKQHLVFQSFSQIDGSTTRLYGGTGLGTTISKELVEMMGGQIGVESRDGQGSKFWFTIVFDQEKSIGANEWNDPDHDFDLNSIHILLVENNDTRKFIFSEYIQSLGGRVSHAATSKQGIEILDASLKNDPVDMLLAGSDLPGAGGFELCETVRRRFVFKTLPMVLMARAGQAGDGHKCRDIGIDGYLSTPIKKTELQKVLIQVLGRGEPKSDQGQPLVTRHYLQDLKARGLKILVAEDYPTNQQIALRHLGSQGFDAVLAENGEQAVDLFKKNRFDLIFMDIQMPKMDGYQATRKIRDLEAKIQEKLDTHTRIPIIATTAHALKGYREKCIQAQMDDYLTKPLKQRDLIDMVEKWIQPESGKLEPGRPGFDSSAKPAFETKDQEMESGKFPIDLAQALEEFENDSEFLNEIIDAFLIEVGRQLKQIRSAVDGRDYTVIEHESHSVKGGAANLVARDLSNAAWEMEQLGKNKDSKGLEPALSRMESAYERLRQYVER